jgi:hypothetical protein
MLYSPEYQKQQEKLHNQEEFYGVKAGEYGEIISMMVDRMEIDHLLDYGCGKAQSLTETLKPNRPLKYQAYDIGVPEYADPPIPADMVVCIDVLEHIEPEYLENVLDHLEELTEVILFATIHTWPAGKTLDDGRNAHLTQQPYSWWLPKLWERFEIQSFQQLSFFEFAVIAHNQNLSLEKTQALQDKEGLILE